MLETLECLGPGGGGQVGLHQLNVPAPRCRPGGHSNASPWCCTAASGCSCPVTEAGRSQQRTATELACCRTHCHALPMLLHEHAACCACRLVSKAYMFESQSRTPGNHSCWCVERVTRCTASPSANSSSQVTWPQHARCVRPVCCTQDCCMSWMNSGSCWERHQRGTEPTMALQTVVLHTAGSVALQGAVGHAPAAGG